MGLIGAAYGLGFTVGPAIGGLLSQYGYAIPAFFASALALANFGAAWWLPAGIAESIGPATSGRTRVELAAPSDRASSTRNLAFS